MIYCRNEIGVKSCQLGLRIVSFSLSTGIPTKYLRGTSYVYGCCFEGPYSGLVVKTKIRDFIMKCQVKKLQEGIGV